MKRIWKSPRTIVLAVLAVALILSLTANLTFAYLVRKKTARNVFTVGVAELTIEEDSFPAEAQERWLVPKSFLPKNPRLVNTGTTSVYAFLEVTVPYDNVQLILDEGEHIREPDPRGRQLMETFNLFSDDEEALSAASTEGFTNGFTVTDTGQFTYHHRWIFLSSKEDTANHTHSYLFGYPSLLTPEAGENTTETIFDRIQLRNILEDDLSENAVRTITITAYGIQSDELQDVTVTDASSLTQDELRLIYRYYQNQEGD